MRLTLEDQIKVNKMTDEECVKALTSGVSFWIFCRSKFLWTIIYWNWFDIWKGSENADNYRPWYIKLKRKLLGGNEV